MLLCKSPRRTDHRAGLPREARGYDGRRRYLYRCICGSEFRGMATEAALRFAAAAAALTVTRPGAQASIPSKQEIELFLEKQPASAH